MRLLPLAYLDETGSRVLCGHCGREIARVPEHRGWIAFGEGWVCNSRRWPDLWQLSKRTAKRLSRGQTPRVRRHQSVAPHEVPFEMRTERLPAAVKCHGCGSKQILDPEALNVSLGKGLSDPWPSPLPRPRRIA